MAEVISKRQAQIMRDAFAKTAKLLVKDGIRVTMQGTTPMVVHRNGKVVRLNLPPIPDNADPKLLVAMQGYLDHEVAHIHYTNFLRGEALFKERGRPFHSMMNIIEDIRIEKLLPEKFPGAKINLARMRAGAFGETLHKYIKEALATGDPKRIQLSMIVPGFRALAGQPELRELFDEHGYWPHLQPLVDRIPDLERKLQSLETYEDVERLATEIFDIMKEDAGELSPEMGDAENEAGEEGEAGDEEGAAGSSGNSDQEEQGDDDGDGDGDADSDDSGDDASDSGDGSDPSEDSEGEGSGGEGEDSDDDAEGEGQGDGADSDDDEGEGDASGDDSGGESGESEGQGEPGDGDDGGADSTAGDSDGDAGGESGDRSGKSDRSDEGDVDGDTADKDGKKQANIDAALRQLDPTSRRVLFMYKKERKTVAEIAGALSMNEAQVEDILRGARRKLPKILKGKNDE